MGRSEELIQWYVWVLGRWVQYEDPNLEPEWATVGIYSSHDKALAAALTGDGIWCVPVDDTATAVYRITPEWVQK